MKILNIHGFMGEADNKNYKSLCRILPADTIISPKLYYKEEAPEKILEQLSEMIDSDDFVFVGQSLGGWYADKLSRRFSRPCILTNPCFYPHALELISESGMPSEFLEQYRMLSSYDKNNRAYTLCSDADEILPDNYTDCVKLSYSVTGVCGGHSTIEDRDKHLSDVLTEIKMNVL